MKTRRCSLVMTPRPLYVPLHGYHFQRRLGAQQLADRADLGKQEPARGSPCRVLQTQLGDLQQRQGSFERCRTRVSKPERFLQVPLCGTYLVLLRVQLAQEPMHGDEGQRLSRFGRVGQRLFGTPASEHEIAPRLGDPGPRRSEP